MSPNTVDTIHENWPDFATAERDGEGVYHFALRRNGIDLEHHLRQYFRQKRISFHYFSTFPELQRLSRRYPLSAVLLASRGDFFGELELVHSIRQNIQLSIIPVIAHHPDPPLSTIVAAYQNGVEDFIYGEWIDTLAEVRIRRVIERSERDLSVNPSTRLPGPAMIEQEVTRQLQMDAPFALCYADLDNFKAYNDHYGYAYGDRIIKLCGRIIKDVVFDLCREGFVGHVAGDDFIAVIQHDLIDDVCQWIIKIFDALIPNYYAPEDVARGYIEAVSRRGEMEQFPLLTMSLAVVSTRLRQFTHLGEMSKVLAELKGQAKRQPGSSYFVDRRRA